MDQKPKTSSISTLQFQFPHVDVRSYGIGKLICHKMPLLPHYTIATLKLRLKKLGKHFERIGTGRHQMR